MPKKLQGKGFSHIILMLVCVVLLTTLIVPISTCRYLELRSAITI
jgi:hypothetical protein